VNKAADMDEKPLTTRQKEILTFIADHIDSEGFPPTRNIRYCCERKKEINPIQKRRVIITGVRWDESVRRAKRPMWEENYKGKKKTFLHPIIDWTTKDIWKYIHEYNLPYCSLYDEGFERIGCIMCPLQKSEGILREAMRYPRFYRAYLRTFKKAIEAHPELHNKEGCKTNTPEKMMHWWIYGFELDETTTQTELLEYK
jgi:phosphoadenosine phosphosulfate reductase